MLRPALLVDSINYTGMDKVNLEVGLNALSAQTSPNTVKYPKNKKQRGCILSEINYFYPTNMCSRR